MSQRLMTADEQELAMLRARLADAEQERDRYKSANEAVQVFEGAMTALEQERDRLKTENEFHANAHANWRHKYEALLTEHDKVQGERDRLRSEVEQRIADHKYVLAEHDKIQADRDRLREERDEARAAVKVAHSNDVWFWQGKNDHPESLTCPVVMSADTLRSMVAGTDRLREDRDYCAKQYDGAKAEAYRLRGYKESLLAEREARIAELDRLREALGRFNSRIKVLSDKLDEECLESERLESRVRELTGALDAAAKSLMAVRHWDRDDKEQPGTGPRLYAENRARVARAVLESALPQSHAPEAPRCACTHEQGDSPCPVHGDEECFDCGTVYVKANGHECKPAPEATKKEET